MNNLVCEEHHGWLEGYSDAMFLVWGLHPELCPKIEVDYNPDTKEITYALDTELDPPEAIYELVDERLYFTHQAMPSHLQNNKYVPLEPQACGSECQNPHFNEKGEYVG